MRILIIIASLLLAMGCAEFAANLLQLAPANVPYWRTNPRSAVMRHSIPEFDVTYRTNLQGLREAGEIQPKSDKIRVVHIGDSYTFGWGVEEKDSVPCIIEGMLRQRFGSDVEVVNFGVPGTNPFNFLKYASRYVRQLQPDLVIVSIYEVRNTFLGGDVAANGNVAAYLKGAEGWAERPDDPEANFRNSLFYNSSLARLAYRAVRRIDWQYYNVDWPGPAHTILNPAAPDDLYMASDDALPSDSLLSTMRNWTLQNPETRPQRLDDLQATFSLAAMIRDAVRPADYVTLILPVGWQFVDYSAEDPCGPIAMAPSMNEEIARLCQDKSLQCVNASARMRSFARGRVRSELFFKDTHFTPETNAVFADVASEAIAPMIEDRKKRR